MMMKVPIIMGSTSDEKYADSLIKLADEFNMKNYTKAVEYVSFLDVST